MVLIGRNVRIFSVSSVYSGGSIMGKGIYVFLGSGKCFGWLVRGLEGIRLEDWWWDKELYGNGLWSGNG